MRVSVAVPAYNEERNIGLLIDTLRAQKTRRAELVEIVVITSGCTDRTVDIVREAQQRRGAPVRLIVEPQRRGKVAAINTYLQHQVRESDAICLSSADVLPAPDALERLVQTLLINHDIGMCGARPVPTNGYGTFPGEATRFLWHMHHKVALEQPKLGELVMLRTGIVHGMPAESCVDEATLEQLIVTAGYRLAYVPEAVVHNHGPETLRDFVRQRRRIAAGHYWLRAVSGYTVATMDVSRLARLTLSELSLKNPKRTAVVLGTIGVEAVSRGLGWFDFRAGKTHHIWKISETTKQVISDELRGKYEAELDLPARQAANT
jgi:cellulose synthase/poly-beta-1,6-N-acetylglucosamine synthase-like glycosyltransferase